MTDTYIVSRRPDGYIFASNTQAHRAEGIIRNRREQGYEVYGRFDDWRRAKICIWAKRLEQGWQPLWVTVDRVPDDERDTPGPIGVVCEAFLLCTNQAEMLIDHPKLIKVPACKRCARVLGHIPPET